jgi:hypothetical protein
VLQLSNDLHCLLILLLPEFHFLDGGVQFPGEHSGKIHLLLELEVSLIRYKLHMVVGRSATSLGKVGILCSIQELVMTRMSDHVSLTGDIMNSSIEVASWSNGGMGLLDIKNSSKGLGSEDVDLNMPHGFWSLLTSLEFHNTSVASRNPVPVASSIASW